MGRRLSCTSRSLEAFDGNYEKWDMQMPRGRNILGSGKSYLAADIYTRWLERADSYSRRSLTNERDKLLAGSGLAAAAAVAATIEDIYLADVWSSDLIRGVL
jgi:hypothetical protein